MLLDEDGPIATLAFNDRHDRIAGSTCSACGEFCPF